VISRPEKKECMVKSFEKYCVGLIDLLKKGGPVDAVEHMRIENHLLMVQMEYVAWKHRNKQTRS
jgi:hypothetical protein